MSSPRFCSTKSSRSNLRKSASTSDANPPSPARSFASQTRSKVREFALFPGAAHKTDSDSDSVVSGKTTSTGLGVSRLRKDSSGSSLSFTNLLRRVRPEKKLIMDEDDNDDDQIQASVPDLDINSTLSQQISYPIENRLGSNTKLDSVQQQQQVNDCQLGNERKEEVVKGCLIVEDLGRRVESSKSERMDHHNTLNEQDSSSGTGFGFLSFRFPTSTQVNNNINRQRARTMTEPISESDEIENSEIRVQSSSSHILLETSGLSLNTSRTPDLNLDIKNLGINHHHQSTITTPHNNNDEDDDGNSIHQKNSDDGNLFEVDQDYQDDEDGDQSSFCTVSSETPELERDGFCFPKWPSEN